MEAQTEGATEKDESVRRTSWSWPGGPGRAATLRTQKKRGGREDKKKKRKVAFQKIIWASSSIGTVGMAPEGRPLSGEVC